MGTFDVIEQQKIAAAGGGWSSSGPITIQNTQTGVKLAVDFPKSGQYTVQFGVEPAIDPATQLPYASDTQATISWSVAGNTVQRVVSVGNGVSVSGTGQAVTVVVRDVTVNTSAPAGTKYNVSVQVSPGTRASNGHPAILISPLSRTQLAPAPGPGEFVIFDIPANSGVISVEVEAGDPVVGGTPMDVVISQFSGANVYKTYTYSGPVFVPVAPSATKLIISNQNAADAVDVSVTWGIDG